MKLFKNNFKKLFNKSDKYVKNKIIKCLMEIGKKNLIDEYFKISNKGKDEHSKIIKVKLNKLAKILIKEKRPDYLKKTNKELLNDDIYLNNVYQVQKGNKLLLITFFAQKKMEEKGFMDKLEKNYGIYLEVDDFIKEMKEKLSEIKTYSQFFQYVGSEYGKNKSDDIIIREAYEKAKLNHYIIDNDNDDHNNSLNNSGIFIRGRSFRGRGRLGRGNINRGRGRGRGE